jgi:UPF0755 protein
MSRRAMRGALVVFALTVVALVVAGVLLYRYALRFPERPAGPPGQKIALVIPSGANFPQVVALLAQQRLISSAAAFRLYVNYKGQASKIRAGSYTFPSDVTPSGLLEILVHGVPAPAIAVLIPEGRNMIEIAELLAEAKVAPKAALLKEMRNKRFLARLGVPGDSIEGYLFPDTYRLRESTPAQDVLTKLCQRQKGVYAALAAKHGAALKFLRKKLAWGKHEIVILASIVEKETGQKFERPLIASVFLNRLTLGGFSPRLLQTDPTIIYGCTVPTERSAACKKFEGRIRRIHLDDKENVYNTYTHVGLPPGPISNPGRAALEAVLTPQKSRYLYFVSKNDGTHQFSATKAEHEAAVDRYQRRRSSKGLE